MGKKEIELKKMMPKEEFIAYLENLLESFKSGQVVVQSGDHLLNLKPPAVFEVTVEAKQKKDKEKLSFKMAWKLDATADSGADLRISPRAAPETGSDSQ
jgi:amphi-Trp domain-containing protein